MEHIVSFYYKNLLFLFFFVLFSSFIATSAHSYDKVFRVGVVPQFDTHRLHTIWNPILEHLSKLTGFQFKLITASSIEDFEKAFMNGEYDFAYMNPYHFILANKLQGYLPLVRDVGKKLQGILVVNKDSGIDNVSQLQGKIIAFPSPNALGASLQMRQELVDDFSMSIKPSYVNNHDSVYINVLLGEEIAGGGVEKTLKQQPLRYQDALKIIHKTRAVPPHPLVVKASISRQIRDKVINGFLAMGTTKKGTMLLANIPIKQIGYAKLEDYELLKAMKLERFYKKPE